MIDWFVDHKNWVICRLWLECLWVKFCRDRGMIIRSSHVTWFRRVVRSGTLVVYRLRGIGAGWWVTRAGA